MSRPLVPQGVFAILFPVLIIYISGLLMIFDAISGEAVGLGVSYGLGGFYRQIMWGVLSFGAAMVAYTIGWQRIVACSPYLYIGALVALLLVFVPHIGVCVNGARRWIGMAGFSVQPSEFVKIILPAFWVWYCTTYPKVFSDVYAYIRLIGIAGLAVVCIIVEPNNGTAAVIALLIGMMTLVVGIPSKFWALPLCIIALGIGAFAISSPYVRSRLLSYRNPELDIRGKGHQPYQAKIAAGSGGLFGRGPAQSLQKFSYLPEAQNDYIAAIYAEEFGFVGITALLCVYGWLFHEVWKIVAQVADDRAYAFGMAIFFLLSFQTFMNLGVVSGLLPSTGLNLPFFSQGGSSLLANSFGIGMLLSMQRRGAV